MEREIEEASVGREDVRESGIGKSGGRGGGGGRI